MHEKLPKKDIVPSANKEKNMDVNNGNNVNNKSPNLVVF